MRKSTSVPHAACKPRTSAAAILPKATGLLLAAHFFLPLTAEAQIDLQRVFGTASRSERPILRHGTSPVRPVSHQSIEKYEPSYQGVYEEETGFPDEIEYHGHDAAGHCNDPVGSCDGPGGCGSDASCDNGFLCYRPSGPLCGRLRVRGEYLSWWTQGSNVPPLVTTSPAGTPRGDAGVLGLDTSLLFGDSGLADGARSGGRIMMTWWLRPDRCVGIEAIFLGTGEEATRFRATSDGTPILARPFFNIVTGVQDARLIAFEPPPGVTGSIAVDATTELQGVEVLLRRALFRRCDVQTDVVFGYRFNRLNDDLLIGESSVSTDPFSLGTTFDLFDQFDTRNEFHGGELGVVFEKRSYCWSWELSMKLGLGTTRSRVLIDGSTTTTAVGVDPVTTTGGVLALPSNVGVYEQSHFSMIPELGITMSCDLTRRLRATFGYTLLYWSRVARPGDQIDFDVNESQFSGGTLSGAPQPEFSWVTTDFWAQGLNLGLEYRF